MAKSSVVFVQPRSEVGQVGGENQNRNPMVLTPFVVCFLVCFLLIPTLALLQETTLQEARGVAVLLLEMGLLWLTLPPGQWATGRVSCRVLPGMGNEQGRWHYPKILRILSGEAFF